MGSTYWLFDCFHIGSRRTVDFAMNTGHIRVELIVEVSGCFEDCDKFAKRKHPSFEGGSAIWVREQSLNVGCFRLTGSCLVLRTGSPPMNRMELAARRRQNPQPVRLRCNGGLWKVSTTRKSPIAALNPTLSSGRSVVMSDGVWQLRRKATPDISQTRSVWLKGWEYIRPEATAEF